MPIEAVPNEPRYIAEMFKRHPVWPERIITLHNLPYTQLSYFLSKGYSLTAEGLLKPGEKLSKDENRELIIIGGKK